MKQAQPDADVPQELLTPGRFTRKWALAVLEEFSREPIALWLRESGFASEASELLSPFDSMGCALTKFVLLSIPDGARDTWKIEQREFHDRIIAYACFRLSDEMRRAGFYEQGASPQQAVKTAINRWLHWRSSLSDCKPPIDDPKSGEPRLVRPRTREELLWLIGACKIMPRIAGAEKWRHPERAKKRLRNYIASLKIGKREPAAKKNGRWILPSKAVMGAEADAWGRKPKRELNVTENGSHLVETLEAPVVEIDERAVVQESDVLAIIDRGRQKGRVVDAAKSMIMEGLTYAEASRRFGVSVDDIRAAEAWLRREGEKLNRNRQASV